MRSNKIILLLSHLLHVVLQIACFGDNSLETFFKDIIENFRNKVMPDGLPILNIPAMEPLDIPFVGQGTKLIQHEK